MTNSQDAGSRQWPASAIFNPKAKAKAPCASCQSMRPCVHPSSPSRTLLHQGPCAVWAYVRVNEHMRSHHGHLLMWPAAGVSLYLLSWLRARWEQP